MERYRLTASQNSAKRRYSLVIRKVGVSTDLGWSLIEVPLELGWHRRWCVRLDLRSRPGQELIGDARSSPDMLTQLATSGVSRPDDLLQADRLASQLLADCPTQEALLVIDPDLSQITRVIADDYLLADVGSQRQVDVAEALEVKTVLMNARGSGHRQQAKVELLQGVGMPREETTRLPPSLGGNTCLTVQAVVVVVQEE